MVLGQEVRRFTLTLAIATRAAAGAWSVQPRRDVIHNDLRVFNLSKVSPLLSLTCSLFSLFFKSLLLINLSLAHLGILETNMLSDDAGAHGFADQDCFEWLLCPIVKDSKLGFVHADHVLQIEFTEASNILAR